MVLQLCVGATPALLIFSLQPMVVGFATSMLAEPLSAVETTVFYALIGRI